MAAFKVVGLVLALTAGQGFADHDDRKLDYVFNSGTRALSDELCWERCFQVEDTDYERFREIYDDFYRMGAEARKLKNLCGVNGTALLIDSTLAKHHGDPALNLDWEDQAANLFQFEKDLAFIITLLLGTDNDHNPVYIYQFNEEYAYTCDNFQCLDACEAGKLIETELDNIQTEDTSHRDGNVEAACGMAKRHMQSATCDASVKNAMAIAILNSDIRTHDHGLSSESSSSSSSSESWEYGQTPCVAHFDTRFAVGTHAAGWDTIKKFSSKSAKGFYIHDNEYTMKAARNLAMCLSTRCCPTGVLYTWWDTDIEAGQCYITTSEFGESETDFDDHDGED